MSAFLTVLYRDRVSMITDAAVLDREGNLIATYPKIIRAGNGVLTVRGEHAVGLAIAESVRRDPPRILSIGIYRILHEAEMQCAYLGERARQYEVTIGEWLSGPRVWYLAGHDLHGERWQLQEVADPVFGAPTPDPDALTAVGFAAPPDPADFDIREHGLSYLEAMRRTPVALPFADDDRRRHIVGGYASLATVTAEGVDLETLRVWPDCTGEPIRPGGYGARGQGTGPALRAAGFRRS